MIEGHDSNSDFARIIIESEIFDPEWYIENYHDVGNSDIDPLEHFLTTGVFEGRAPSAKFDGNYYVSRYPDVLKSGMHPLEHYIKYGRQAGMSGSRLYQVGFVGSLADVIAESGIFDQEWYIRQYPDVISKNVEPFEHYSRTGIAEHRNPGPGFSEEYYVSQNPSIINSFYLPFEHYLRIGINQGLLPIPMEEGRFDLLLEASGLFDREYYLETYLDVKRAGADPFDHFVNSGAIEKRDPGPFFETKFYEERYPQVQSVPMSPIEHYLRIGRKSGFICKGPPPYTRWLERYEHLSDDDVRNIMDDIDASAPSSVIALRIGGDLGRDDGIVSQIGYVPDRISITSQKDIEPAMQRICALRPSDIVLAYGDACFFQPHAAYVFHKFMQAQQARVAYSDHDHVDDAGDRYAPVFKPIMSPKFLTQFPYQGPMLAWRADAWNVGLLATMLTDALIDLTGAFARLIGGAKCADVAHIPLPLYSVMTDKAAEFSGRSLMPYEPHCLKHSGAKFTPSHYVETIDIIIPTRDCLDITRECIDSIIEKTRYSRDLFNIIIVDNDSVEDATLEYFRAFQTLKNCRVVPSPGAFNFSKICNEGARAGKADFVLFLNNDVTVLDPDWLAKMVDSARMDDVGIVGARLLYPDLTVQHGGIVTGFQGIGVHRLVGVAEATAQQIDYSREMSAITGACIMLKRSIYEQAGGFDEALGVAFNDVSLCLSVSALGYRNLYLADALLIHHESKSRGLDDNRPKAIRNTLEAIYARHKHPDAFRNDPYYSPNLSFDRLGQIAFPPRITRPWRKVYKGRSVLILSVGHGIGHGVGAVVEMQAAFLLEQGWHVTIGGPISRYDREYTGCVRIQLDGVVEAAEYVASTGFDAVIVHTPPFYSITRYLSSKPLVYIYDHGEPTPSLFDDYNAREDIDREKRFSAALARRKFVISKAIYEQQFDKDAIILRNGNSHLSRWSEQWQQRRDKIRKKLGLEDNFVILNVCRFHQAERRYKGVDQYIELASEARYAIPGAGESLAFLLAGRGDEEDIKYVKSRGIRAHANVSNEELAELYAAADLYVNLSQWEGYNLGIGQALAMGLAAVASDIPAHREFGIEVSSATPELCRLVGGHFRQWKLSPPIRAGQIDDWRDVFINMLEVIESDLEQESHKPLSLS
jgi:GT2 family glycosyltransferase